MVGWSDSTSDGAEYRAPERRGGGRRSDRLHTRVNVENMSVSSGGVTTNFRPDGDEGLGECALNVIAAGQNSGTALS